MILLKALATIIAMSALFGLLIVGVKWTMTRDCEFIAATLSFGLLLSVTAACMYVLTTIWGPM